MGAAPADVSRINWYHTIELPGGVVTPGFFDTRRAAKRLPLPDSLTGKRCLDVGTADGFWAFEMERRGAREVLAIDVDDPARRDWPWNVDGPALARKLTGRGEAFWTAHRALGSKVLREDLSIYDLSPETVGRFDFVFIGSLLLHLRDPVRALAAVRSVVDGELLVGDAVSVFLTVMHPFGATAKLDAKRPQIEWWTPNMVALRRMVSAGGYDIVASGGPYFLRAGPGLPRAGFLKAARAVGLRTAVASKLIRTFGSPHGWVRARPKQ